METKQRFDVDPFLEKISRHVPDEEINLLFPFRKFDVQGRTRKFKTNQLYRAHILPMLKGVNSFNKLCYEFKTRRSFRDFCRFKNKQVTPTKRMLSEFRDQLKASGFEKIAQLITATFLRTISLPEVTVAIPDATDMPASCTGFSKKNAPAPEIVFVQSGTQLREQPKESERRKVGKAHTSLDIKSILCAFG